MTTNPKTTVNFSGKDYSEDSLKSMDLPSLLELRNLVAANLGVARIQTFKDMATATSATWKALQKYEDTMNEESNTPDGETTPPAVKTPAEPKPTPACYSEELVKRPTRRMFGRIEKIGEPDKSQRPFAWPQFENGMRLIDIKEDANLHAGKISFWMRQDPPLIKLNDISDEQYEEELNAWYAKHGLTNPDAAKKAAKAEREAAKVARVAEKAKAREAAKAAKALEKAEKDKEREAAKLAKAAEAEKAAKAKAEAKAKAAEAKPAPAASKG